MKNNNHAKIQNSDKMKLAVFSKIILERKEEEKFVFIILILLNECYISDQQFQILSSFLRGC